MDYYRLRLNNIIENKTYLISKNSNIIGMGIGNKIINGKMTNIPSLTFLVEKKIPLNNLNADCIVPPIIFGIYTDIIEVKKNANSLTIPLSSPKVRPATGGVSIGTKKNTLGGTLGYPVISKNDIFILTGPGVISDDLLGVSGANIYQPSNSLNQEDRLGEFRSAIKLTLPKDPMDDNPKTLNGALGEIAYIGVNTAYTRKIIQPKLSDGTIVTKVKNSPSSLKDIVKLIGAKSGVVAASIVATDFSGRLRVTHKSVLDTIIGIKGALHIQCNTNVNLTPSDVGALVVSASEPNKAIGLLVAGLGNAGIVCPLQNILTELKVNLLVD